MARKEDKWWHYWLPGYGHYLRIRDAIQEKDPFAGLKHSFGIGLNGNEEDSNLVDQTTQILGQVVNDSRQEYLEDREHTEAREDSSYQRGVQDMQKAGLNPYTIGASPSPSSVSNVGENAIMSKLQALGYILDLRSLDLKNKQFANQAISGVIKALK